MATQDSLNRLIASERGKADCHEVALCVMQGDDMTTAAGGRWNGGTMTADTPFLIASTSKLLVSAMIFRLADDGLIRLDDPLLTFFPGELGRLHVWQGEDMTGRITIRHLLTHSSGLADYFEGQRREGASLASQLFAGRDVSFGLADVIHWVRDDMSPAFAPGTAGLARYSDTNFYLLTEIVARVRGQPPDDALRDLISAPLGLTQTRFFKPGDATLPLRLGNRMLDIPHALASMPGDGGAISTARELTVFASAFFGGRLFDLQFMSPQTDWRRLFFPLDAGLGVLRFHLPWFLPPFRKGMEFIGHSGISGAFVYRWPKEDMIISGTINQINNRRRPYRVMVKAALNS